jgi:hypothetical protein
LIGRAEECRVEAMTTDLRRSSVTSWSADGMRRKTGDVGRRKMLGDVRRKMGAGNRWLARCVPPRAGTPR